MSRSSWKGKFLNSNLLKKISKKVWCRNFVIPFSFIGQKILVYNGKEFKRIYITREKVGYKFGDFSFTRKYTKKIKTSKSKK